MSSGLICEVPRVQVRLSVKRRLMSSVFISCSRSHGHTPVGGAVRGAVGAEPSRFAQRPRVPLVGLDAPIAGGVHGREVRIRDDDLVAEPFEVACAPLALGRGLDEDARWRPLGEELVEALPIGLDAALYEFALFCQDADLTRVLMQVDADVIHGWS
jgi:hypothetical protein